MVIFWGKKILIWVEFICFWWIGVGFGYELWGVLLGNLKFIFKSENENSMILKSIFFLNIKFLCNLLLMKYKYVMYSYLGIF